MSSNIESLLGIDISELEWRDLSLCHNTMATELFFDDYESDEQVAKLVDDVCLSCPVMKQCLQRGTDNGEWGCWGGIYLVNGRPDANKNAHKTPEMWSRIKERISS